MGKNQDKIPVSKIGRAGKLIGTGAKIGTNYLQYYAKKLVGEDAQNELNEKNAEDIYESLSELKGGPLKIAQMLSMGQDILPKPYVDKFEQSQNNVPPLSYPLIKKTFKQYNGKSPDKLFDEFSKHAVNAATIGQVHKGRIGDKWYAIKIQYPGIAESIQSDLKMVKPLATRMLHLNQEDMAYYMKEVESKLMEETDYELEVRQSIELSENCKHLNNLIFAKYYPKWSSSRIIVMDWLEGVSLKEWMQNKPSQKLRNEIGQTLWDFYQYQIHVLLKMHADPHPGNFIINDKNEVGIIDFGCMKAIPRKFYLAYVKLHKQGILDDPEKLMPTLEELEIIHPKDNKEDRKLIFEMFQRLFKMVSMPFYTEEFDFGDNKMFEDLYETGEAFSQDKKMRKLSSRGSKHFIYFNRTYLGLFQLLNLLGAKVKTDIPKAS